MLEWDGPDSSKRKEVRERAMNRAIGIDSDSKGYVCCLVDVGEAQGKRIGYLTTVRDLESLVRWVKKEGEPIVAIEGSNGFSKPVEDAFRREQVVFYSLKPSDVSKFRKVVLGQNKNNDRDAESVARYALALQAQGKLEQFRRLWFPDEALRLLTRGYERKSKELTAEISRMWKVLRIASPDLYLALRGSNPEVEMSDNGLKIQGILSLLEQKPDLSEWKDLSAEDFLTAMGGGNYRGRQQLIDELQKLSDIFSPTPPAVSLMIKTSAQTILQAMRQLKEMKRLLRDITAENIAVKTLEQIRGISVLSSSTLMSEIIDIRRFANDDRLASYSGLGRSEYSTGERSKMIPNPQFNRRLKDVFITAAKNFVRYNPDSHLTGYFRNLVKKRGMKANEAYKRVARALVRVTFRKLRSLVEESSEKQKRSESDMASGSEVRSDLSHDSNISLSSPTQYDKRTEGKIKGGKRDYLEKEKMILVENFSNST
jgi:transposase